VAGVAAAVLLPYRPLAAPLGFTPLYPATYRPIVATLVVVYLALVEMTKRALHPRRPAPDCARIDTTRGSAGCTAAPHGSPSEPDRGRTPHR
jgi:Mg2+-importing ATPase